MELEEKRESSIHVKKWMTGFAVFFVFMWVCTIVSKSIYVAGLARVTTVTPEKKYIEHIVEADGIVVAGRQQAVNTVSGLRVAALSVQEGDRVEKGDLLFSLDLTDLDLVISDKESALAEQQYRLADAQFNHILETQKKDVSIIWAQEDYNSADRETSVAVERAQKELSDAEGELNSHLSTTAPYTSDSERQQAWENYNHWKKRLYELTDAIAAKEREIADLEEKLQANEEVEETKSALQKAKEELVALKEELTALERGEVSMPDYSAEESAYDNWQQKRASLEEAVQSAKQNLEDANYTRESTLRQKRRDLASAEALSPQDSTSAIYELEIAKIQSELAELYSLRQQSGEIRSEFVGCVSKIQIEVGSRTEDAASILLTDDQSPSQFKFSITKEQGKYLQLGDSVTLKINDSSVTNDKIEVSADYLTENLSGGYDIVCRLPEGTGIPGTGGSVKKTVQGELYHSVVPVEALHKESEAYYIYILKEKSGILGNELYVEKLKVRVTDQNDRYAALESGLVSGETEIILDFSEELKQGESVRLSED